MGGGLLEGGNNGANFIIVFALLTVLGEVVCGIWFWIDGIEIGSAILG